MILVSFAYNDDHDMQGVLHDNNSGRLLLLVIPSLSLNTTFASIKSARLNSTGCFCLY